jgi:hypothetical protein
MNYLQTENNEQDIKLHVDSTFTSGYCPISNKEKMNPPATNYLDNLSNIDIFLSKKNIHYMTYYLVSMNKANMTGVNPSDLAPLVPNMMIEWAKKNNIGDSEYIYDNILLTLEFLNKKFIINHAYDKNDKSNINVFRGSGVVTIDSCGNEETKKYSEMTADNYKNIDVWQDRQEYTYDKRNRYGNSIPIWQRSMNIRHYDHESDGLHTSNPDRASLDNQVRGYNMDNIIKGSDFYQN